jgi:DNA-binding NtrC family response regulator
MSAFKRDLILRALERYDGNRSYAAASLGIDRTSLLRLIRELGVGGLPAAHNGRPPASGIHRGRAKAS